MYHLLQCLFPFAFDHGWTWRLIALRWHISVGYHGKSNRINCPDNVRLLKRRESKVKVDKLLGVFIVEMSWLEVDICQLSRVGRATEKALKRVNYIVWTAAVMYTNGTAIWGGCVTRRSNRPVNCPVRPGHCPGARRVWRTFCHHVTNFIGFWCDRRTSLISGRELVTVPLFC